MANKELAALRESMWIMTFFSIGTIFLFVSGILTQYQFLQRLINRDIIQPTELKIEYFDTILNSGAPDVTAVGYIDSSKVSMIFNKKYLIKGKKRTIPVWYNTASKKIFYRGPKDNGVKFSIAIWSWYYFKWFVFTILPHLFLSRAFYRKYKEYKIIKNEIKTKK